MREDLRRRLDEAVDTQTNTASRLAVMDILFAMDLSGDEQEAGIAYLDERGVILTGPAVI